MHIPLRLALAVVAISLFAASQATWLSAQSGNRERTLFVSALNEKGEPVEGLGPDAFVVRAKDVPESSLWVHDVHDRGAALVLANMPSPAFPIPIGVLASIEAPAYEDILLDQEQRAISDRGPGDIAKLLVSGDTWKIG